MFAGIRIRKPVQCRTCTRVYENAASVCLSSSKTQKPEKQNWATITNVPIYSSKEQWFLSYKKPHNMTALCWYNFIVSYHPKRDVHYKLVIELGNSYHVALVNTWQHDQQKQPLDDLSMQIWNQRHKLHTNYIHYSTYQLYLQVKVKVSTLQQINPLCESRAKLCSTLLLRLAVYYVIYKHFQHCHKQSTSLFYMLPVLLHVFCPRGRECLHELANWSINHLKCI